VSIAVSTPLTAILGIYFDRWQEPWGWVVLSVVVIAALYVAWWQITAAGESRETLEHEIQEANRVLCEEQIQQALRQIAEAISKNSDSSHTRSNVFTIGDDNKLGIVYHYNMDGAPDLSVRFDKHQGCVGHVWGTGHESLADLADLNKETLNKDWKLTPAQIKLTEEVGCVIATPIWHPYEKDALIGVLSVDGPGTLASQGWGETKVRDACAVAARSIGALLLMGGICDGQE
jgi:hypothetical protein